MRKGDRVIRDNAPDQVGVVDGIVYSATEHGMFAVVTWPNGITERVRVIELRRVEDKWKRSCRDLSPLAPV
jgi:hypothetical protein